MQASEQATLKTADGKNTSCDTVFVGTGGHRLAPGFQMRGYTAGTKAKPQTQLIYVECKGAQAAPGSTLSIDYSYVTGMLNYFEQDANKDSGTLVLNLDQVVTGLTYPIAEAEEDLIQKSDATIECHQHERSYADRCAAYRYGPAVYMAKLQPQRISPPGSHRYSACDRRRRDHLWVLRDHGSRVPPHHPCRRHHRLDNRGGDSQRCEGFLYLVEL